MALYYFNSMDKKISHKRFSRKINKDSVHLDAMIPKELKTSLEKYCEDHDLSIKSATIQALKAMIKMEEKGKEQDKE